MQRKPLMLTSFNSSRGPQHAVWMSDAPWRGVLRTPSRRPRRAAARAVGFGDAVITPGGPRNLPSSRKELTAKFGIAAKPSSALICRVASVRSSTGKLYVSMQHERDAYEARLCDVRGVVPRLRSRCIRVRRGNRADRPRRRESACSCCAGGLRCERNVEPYRSSISTIFLAMAKPSPAPPMARVFELSTPDFRKSDHTLPTGCGARYRSARYCLGLLPCCWPLRPRSPPPARAVGACGQFQRRYPFKRLSKSSIGLSTQAWVTKSRCLASAVARNVTLPWRRAPCSDVLNATFRSARMR